MREGIYLAKKMGTLLGGSKILQRCLPEAKNEAVLGQLFYSV